MASTRLNAETRARIRLAALNHRFAKPEQALREAEEKLFTAVRQAKYGKAICAQMDALPKGWLPLTSFFDVKIGGRWRRLTTAHPVREASQITRTVDLDKLPDRLRKRVAKHVLAREEMQRLRSELRNELTAALRSFSTVESLLKHWPELDPFTKGIERASGNALTVPIADLNNALGIAA